VYGDGLKRGPSAGELADAFVAALDTGRLDPALAPAVGKMFGVKKAAEPMAASPILPPGASMEADNIETLQDAVAVLQGIIDGRR